MGLVSHSPASHQRWPHRIKTMIAVFITLLSMSLLTEWITPGMDKNLLVASIGASTILVYILYTSPVSQPYALIMGNTMAAAIGVGCAYLPFDFYISAALCLTLCFFMMFVFNCIHPPAGATALMPVILGYDVVHGVNFIVFPVLTNVVILIFMAIILHRFWLKTEYPAKPLARKDIAHKREELSPLSRFGIEQLDLKSALKEYDAYLNISEKDLALVYRFAQQHVFCRRYGDIRCVHVMSKNVISVTPDTELEVAWGLLKYHKIQMLPVVNHENKLLGVVSTVDFLKKESIAMLNTKQTGLQPSLSRLVKLVKKKTMMVKDLMTVEVSSVLENNLLAEVVPLFTDKGLHHIPVIDHGGKLVGIITQSDVIAALYSSAVHFQPE